VLENWRKERNMDPNERISKIRQLHEELTKMFSKELFDKELKLLNNLDVALQVFITNSDVNYELYMSREGRIIQNSLDHDRLQLLELLLKQPNIVLVMGDPRLDEEQWYKYVPYNQDEGKQGPWAHKLEGSLWRAQQAEVWLYREYLKHMQDLQKKGMKTTRLILVSAYPDFPYHRVHMPEDLAKPLQRPTCVQTIELPKKSLVFEPPHPKWPSGLVWVPNKLTRAVYDIPITVYGLGYEKKWHVEPSQPRNSIRDLWMIENCADVTIAFHNGKPGSAEWNYKASVKRDIPSILVTFDSPSDPHSRCIY